MTKLTNQIHIMAMDQAQEARYEVQARKSDRIQKVLDDHKNKGAEYFSTLADEPGFHYVVDGPGYHFEATSGDDHV